MNYTDQEIARQLRLGEDSRWEFKQIEFSGSRPKSPSRDDWADEIAAFANTVGGVLLCGVTDAGEVQGMSREQIVELDSVLVEVSSDAIRPAVRISTYHRELDGKRFLLVKVPQSESQHDSPRRQLYSGRRVKTPNDKAMSGCAWRNGGDRRGSFGSISSPCPTLDWERWKKATLETVVECGRKG